MIFKKVALFQSKALANFNDRNPCHHVHVTCHHVISTKWEMVTYVCASSRSSSLNSLELLGGKEPPAVMRHILPSPDQSLTYCFYDTLKQERRIQVTNLAEKRISHSSAQMIMTSSTTKHHPQYSYTSQIIPPQPVENSKAPGPLGAN